MQKSIPYFYSPLRIFSYQLLYIDNTILKYTDYDTMPHHEYVEDVLQEIEVSDKKLKRNSVKVILFVHHIVTYTRRIVYIYRQIHLQLYTQIVSLRVFIVQLLLNQVINID